MGSYNRVLQVFVISSLLIMTGSLSHGLSDTISSISSLDYSLTQIYNNSSATDLAYSDLYLYLSSGRHQVLFFKNESYQSTYFSDNSIYDITVWNQTLFLETSNGTDSVIRATSFRNSLSPSDLSEVTHPNTGTSGIGAYHSYVYWACQESGFPIFDFSNVTSPQNIGYVPLETWHSRQLRIVSHYGVFSGDFRTGIFDLEPYPATPELLWTKDSAGWCKGFAVSEDYFIVNSDYYTFYILHRSSDGYDYEDEITYDGFKFTECAFFNNNILLVAEQNNTIHVFEIEEENQNITFIQLGEIDFGLEGYIHNIVPIPDSNDYYIADGAKGLLKLTFNGISSTSSEATSIIGFNWYLTLVTLPFTLFIHRNHRRRGKSE